MTVDLTQLTAETCAPLVGTSFSLRHGGDRLDLKVDNIKVFDGSGIRDRTVMVDGVEVPPRRAFAITLVGPHSPQLPQGIHEMTHPQLGNISLFLSNFGSDADGLLYEVVFN